MRIARLSILAGTIALTTATANRASAFNFTSHRRIVEASADAMTVSNNAKPARPSGVSQADWDAFLSRLGVALDNLKLLHSGLPIPQAFDDPAKCQYTLTDPATSRVFDLGNAGLIRIGDLPYYYAGQEPCSYEPLSPEITPVGAVLGWQAATIDEHNNDQVLWVRPTNTAFFGLAQELSSRYTEVVLGAILLPFVCIGQFFSNPSHPSCDASDAFDLGRELNPLDYVQGLVPGVGDYTSDDIGGLFHFIDVNATVNRYNSGGVCLTAPICLNGIPACATVADCPSGFDYDICNGQGCCDSSLIVH